MGIPTGQILNLIAVIERDVQLLDGGRWDDEIWISKDLTEAYLSILNTVEPFNWTKWERGIDAIQSGSDFEDFSEDELLRALYAIFRGNRFTQGIWAMYLSNGTIVKILRKIIERRGQQ